jgi:hypothetical protein
MPGEFKILDPDRMAWEIPGTSVPRPMPPTDYPSDVGESPVKEKWLVIPNERRFSVQVDRFEPNVEFGYHKHSEPELTIFLRGSAIFNGHPCQPGTMVFVDADTPYGPEKAGPDGCEFMIIRPRLSAITML